MNEKNETAFGVKVEGENDSDLESAARPILVKMLDALDNEERIKASSPIELLNCIMKILRMVREDKSSLGDMVKDRLGTIADLTDIKNPDSAVEAGSGTNQQTKSGKN